ncbi:MAG: TraR/DksA C4-type zinc finger protein [Verrucomicrobiae bacterium]|nr:TraR/DksA C4-type zinc finger protein [Verrucomicrobiae bacterium]
MANKKAATKKASKAKKSTVKKAAKSAVKAAKPEPKAKRAKKAAKPAAKAKPKEVEEFDEEEELIIKPRNSPKDAPFMKMQRQRLLDLRDSLVDSMRGVARDNLRTRAEGSEASAYGMHQADAGSDAYDRDFALSLLSQEQDALYEIEEGLKRIELGTYGICEMSGKEINRERLEALPFARFTVECQEKVEKENMNGNFRRPMQALFGGSGESEDDREDSFDDSKD